MIEDQYRRPTPEIIGVPRNERTQKTKERKIVIEIRHFLEPKNKNLQIERVSIMHNRKDETHYTTS